MDVNGGGGLVTQTCPTLCDPRDCSPSGSSVHGTLQARILEWIAIPFSSGCDSWTIKKAERRRIDAFGPVVLEKTLESPLYSKEIQPVHPKGN